MGKDNSCSVPATGVKVLTILVAVLAYGNKRCTLRGQARKRAYRLLIINDSSLGYGQKMFEEEYPYLARYELDDVGNASGIYGRSVWIKDKPVTLGPIEHHECLDGISECHEGWGLTMWLKLMSIPSSEVYFLISRMGGLGLGPSMFFQNSSEIPSIVCEYRTKNEFFSAVAEIDLEMFGIWQLLSMRLGVHGEFECAIGFSIYGQDSDGPDPFEVSGEMIGTEVEYVLGGLPGTNDVCNCMIDDIQIRKDVIGDFLYLFRAIEEGRAKQDLTMEEFRPTNRFPIFVEDGNLTTCSEMTSDVQSVRDTFVEVKWNLEPSYSDAVIRNFSVIGWYHMNQVRVTVSGLFDQCVRMRECTLIDFEPNVELHLAQRSNYLCDCRHGGCDLVYVSLIKTCENKKYCLNVKLCGIEYLKKAT